MADFARGETNARFKLNVILVEILNFSLQLLHRATIRPVHSLKVLQLAFNVNCHPILL